MTRILIVGAGYAGFYTAWHLERHLGRGEASVTVIDPLPYMTYQPFLPEVAAGSVEARHAVVPLRRHLRHTHIISGKVVSIDHGHRQVRALLSDGSTIDVPYDELVVTAGVTSRVLPVPGLAEAAVALRRIEEAVAIRDTVLTAFDEAESLPDGPQRRRRLSFTFVGGGFAGVEGFAEVASLVRDLLSVHPGVSPQEVALHLVEAGPRLLPEMTPKAAEWVRAHLERSGATVHLGTTVTDVKDHRVHLSNGQAYDCGLLVWTAGVAANPVVRRHTDLPVDERGFLRVRPDLRIGTQESPVPHAWAAGDDAAVPDLAGGPGRTTPPTAQHAVRQGRWLAKNLVAVVRGGAPRPYRHRNLGSVATLGLGNGIFQSGPVVVTGLPAWVMHRAYHALAVPGWERKLRVIGGWVGSWAFGRDLASLKAVQQPAAAFRQDAADATSSSG